MVSPKGTLFQLLLGASPMSLRTAESRHESRVTKRKRIVRHVQSTTVMTSCMLLCSMTLGFRVFVRHSELGEWLGVVLPLTCVLERLLVDSGVYLDVAVLVHGAECIRAQHNRSEIQTPCAQNAQPRD